MSSKPVVSSPDEAESIRFEVRDGSRRVSCTVSDEALEAASSLTLPSTAVARRRSFDRFRTLINAAAALKLAGLPKPVSSPLVVTREDLRRVPPLAGQPVFGLAPRAVSRPAAPVLVA